MFEKLKEAHLTLLSCIYLRVWAETGQGRMYTSLEETPNTSMFHHAGGSTATEQKPQSAPVQAFWMQLQQLFQPCLNQLQMQSPCVKWQSNRADVKVV